MDRRERINDPEEALRVAMESQQAAMWTALPGIVSSVDLAAQTVSVQPAIQGSVSSPDGSLADTNLPLLVDVPIVWPRAGGFALTFPVQPGDEVLVVFASRCIDAWWQSGGIGKQAEVRMHDLSDGFAILAPTSQPNRIAGVSASNVQLRSESGSTLVEITPDGKANIVGASEINMTAPTINITGDVNMTGEMSFTGNFTQGSGSMSIGGIVFGTHKHTGVQSGPNSTGGPTN